MKKLLSIAVCASAVAAFATDTEIPLGDVGVTAITSDLTNTIVAVSYKQLGDGDSNINENKNTFTGWFELYDYIPEGSLALQVIDSDNGVAFNKALSLYVGDDTTGDMIPEGYDGVILAGNYIKVGSVYGYGLTGNTTYSLAIADDGHIIYIMTFTTKNYVLDDDKVNIVKEYYEYDGTVGQFYITSLQITGYDPTNNISICAYDLTGQLVQYTDRIIYYAGSNDPAESVDGTITKGDGGAVEDITVHYLELGNLTPGDYYYFRLYDGDTLLYEVKWQAASSS